MIKILVLDDEPMNNKLVQIILAEAGYEVIPVDSPRGALTLLEKHLPDLILLDIDMKQMNGFDFYRRIQEQGYDIPVIFVTASAELEDKVEGLRMGADDYIVKPYQHKELLARVQAVLRRYRKASAQSGGQTIKAGGFELQVADLEVLLPDRRRVSLTHREMKLLAALAARAGQAVGREDLLSAIWGDEYAVESNIVEVYIRRLRVKLEADPSDPRYIQSVRGIGYKFAGK